jgi:hypothetical protein
MARCGDSVRARVLFLKPALAPPGWEQTDLWRRAASIPGVQVLTDEGGAEARRLGAQTSGQAMLYDPGGALLFSGGITPSRGHEGDNAGADAIIALTTQRATGPHAAAVFGCPLQETSAECSGRGETCGSQ